MFMLKKFLSKRMLYIGFYFLFCLFTLSIVTYCYMLFFSVEITINDHGEIYSVESKAVYVTPELNDPISPGEMISIIQHLAVMETSLEEIPFAVEKREDQNLLKGKITTLQEGKTGLREVTFRVVYAGDEELSREFVGESVLEEPVNSIVALGIKVTPSPSPLVIASRGGSNEGIASWYGEQFHGKKTTNGEVFNQNELTAAHPNLPFNTYVNVTYLKTGKSVLVRINDRGPSSRDRIIDLSRAAAEEIGLRPHGIGKVRIEVVKIKSN